MSETIELQRIEILGTARDPDGPHLLITGGVHGDEFESMSAIRRLADIVAPEQLRGRLTLVPVVNEAAFLNGDRTAEDGLDLARVCPGDPDGSVTLRTAVSLSALINSSDYYIDLHSGGIVMDVWPMSGYGLSDDPDRLDTQRRMAQAFNLPVIWGTCGTLDGRSLSVARDAGVPAIYTEYLGSGHCSGEGVQAYVDGCLNVMGELGMIEREAPESRVEIVVEDDRDGSGHMQVQNPSPITGQFTPAVSLGDRVAPGDVLGHVANVLGDDVREIVCTQSGHVLAIRTYPRVHEGDSVLVVMEDVD